MTATAAAKEWWEVAADAIDPAGSIPEEERWVPFPKQALAEEMSMQVDELLFGGAAGPGKTEWGMRHVIDQMQRFPGNRGLIVRRVFPSLQRSIIPRMKIILNGIAKYNQNTHEFTFPNGSVIECASLQYADSVLDFQGAELGVIFFEEITEFLESQWEYLIGRLRAPVDGVFPHAIATTNPGGTGHRWVKRRWVRPLPDDLNPGETLPQPYEVWRPCTTDERPKPLTRVYIPATSEDNPKLLERDPGYMDRLRGISNRGLRLAMEKGDWDAIDSVKGALWTMEDLDNGRISPDRFRGVKTLARVVAVDPSDGEDDLNTGEKHDDFGVCVASRGMDGVAYVERSHSWSASPRKMAEAAVDLYYEVGADALVIERNHGGKWMIEVFQSVDPYCHIIETWASDGKRTRAAPVAALFEHNNRQPKRPYQAKMVGFLPELEEELTTHDFSSGMRSPNKLDAMVWAVNELMIGQRQAHSRSDMKDQRLRGRR